MGISVSGLGRSGYLFEYIEERMRDGVQYRNYQESVMSGGLGSHKAEFLESHSIQPGRSLLYVVKVQSDGEMVRRTFENRNDFEEYAKDLVSRRTFSPLLASFIPARVDTVRHFAKDFFIPTLAHQAPHFEGHKVTRGLIGGVALAWDLVTLPIRALALLPRLALERGEGVHPFLKNWSQQLSRTDSNKLEVHIQFAQKTAEGVFVAGRCGFYVNLTHLRDPGDQEPYSDLKSSSDK